MTYSSDFLRKVLSVREKEGLTIAEVAARFCVGVASVVCWLKTPDLKITRNKPATKIDMEELARDIWSTRMPINMNAHAWLCACWAKMR